MDCPADELVSKLNDILKSASYCFRFGAFVLEDPDGDIFAALRSKRCGTSKRAFGLSSTHSIFKDQASFSKYKTSPNKTARLNPTLQRTAQYEIYSSKTFQWCTPDQRYQAPTVTTLLFYPFEVSINFPEKGRHRYLYFKLESSPWWHPKHAQAAINHYYHKKEKVLAPRENTRREKDSSFESKRMHISAQDWRIYVSAAGNNAAVLKKISNSLAFYENNVRSSAEFFVPYALLKGVSFLTKKKQ